jgi:enoyl-CoA hydratase
VGEPRLLLEVRERVATVTLNHPDRLNAIDDAMGAEFPALLARLAEPQIRVVVFTGSGRAFSAGGAIERFEGEQDIAAFRRESHRLSATFHEIEALEKPVIAALNGVATGAGLQLALACDLRFASETARLGYREHHLGLIPAHGGTARLVKLIGLSAAKDLYFRGDLVSAAEAYRLGLVHRVLPPEDLLAETEREAEALSARAPLALGLAKQLLNRAADTDVESGVSMESFAQGVMRGTKDHQEGLRAFREKRPPEFQGE